MTKEHVYISTMQASIFDQWKHTVPAALLQICPFRGLQCREKPLQILTFPKISIWSQSPTLINWHHPVKPMNEADEVFLKKKSKENLQKHKKKPSD